MEHLTTLLVAAFAVLVGRNDGAPLVALAMRSLHRLQWWPPVLLVAATCLIPALGFTAVASTLATVFDDAVGDLRCGLAVLMFATIATLLISTAAGIPTSITLALVGASAGAQLAHGAVDSDRILRVLALAAAGPIVAWLLALLVTRALSLSRGAQLERTVRWQQVTGFLATAVAYAANDGQKLLAVFAVLFGVRVSAGARNPIILVAVLACFTAGTLLGLRHSTRGLRQGALHPKPYQVASTLWSSASAVLLGASIGAPMSMTQSATAALIGTSPPQQWRRVRWEQSRRVVFAWLWTLPVTALIGWLLTLGAGLLPRG